MSNATQIKTITSQLEVLGDLKRRLGSVIVNIEKVMKKGNSWLEKPNNEQFTVINQFLSKETAECISLCVNIGGDEISSQSSTDDKISDGASIETSVFREEKYQKMCEAVNVLKNESKINADKFQEMNQKLLKLAKQEGDSAKQKKDIEALKRGFDDLKKQQTDHDDKLEKRFKKKETENNKQICDLNEKLESVNKFCNAFKSQIDFLSAKVDKNEETFRVIQQNLEEQVQRLSMIEDNMKTVEENIEIKLSEVKETILTSNNSDPDLQRRLTSMSSQINTVDDLLSLRIAALKREISDVLDKFSMLKLSTDQFINERKKILLDFIEEIKNLKIKNKEISSYTEDLQTKMEKFESNDMAVCFNARVDSAYALVDLQKDGILTCFNSTTINEHNGYDITTGIFTVPVDGIYLCSLIIDVDTDETLYFQVCRKANLEDIIAVSHTGVKKNMICDTSITRFSANEKVYVKSDSTSANIKFSFYSHFICVLMQKC